MPAHFLLIADAFECGSRDFCELLEQLNEAILKAKELGKDKFLYEENLLYLKFMGIDLFEILYSIPESEREKYIPNFSHDIQEILNALLTQNSFNEDFLDFQEKYGKCSGTVGLVSSKGVDKDTFVNDIPSWFACHTYFMKEKLCTSLYENIKKLEGKKFNTYFPNISYCNESFERPEFHKMGSKKMAEIENFGAKIAKFNFYAYDEKITKYNKSSNSHRRIYKSVFTPTHYLSIDFEKGAFEVCDKNGKHLGEFNFDGTRNGEAKNDHSIKLSR
jgi:hypothetical protein